MLLIINSSETETINKLLKAGQYTKENKQSNAKAEKFASIFWSLITVIYLAWSFIWQAWSISWIIWPIAAILSGSLGNYYKYK